MEFTEGGGVEADRGAGNKRDTPGHGPCGARWKRSCWLMYQLPDLQERGKYVITDEVVKGEVALFDRKPIPIKERR